MLNGEHATRRVSNLARHLVAAFEKEEIDPPVVPASQQLSDDPIAFLMQASKSHPEVFAVERPGHRYIVIADSSMFDDVLGDETIFGTIPL